MEIEEADTPVLLQEGHITHHDAVDTGVSDNSHIDKSIFEFDVQIVGKNGQIQLIRKDDNKNRVFKSRLTFHNPKFHFSEWNVVPSKLEDEPLSKKRKHDSSGSSSTSNIILLETKFVVRVKQNDYSYYNTNLEPPSFEEGKIVDLEVPSDPSLANRMIDFRLSKFLTTKEVRSQLKDEYKDIGRDAIFLRFSLVHADSRKEVAHYYFPWANPPKRALPSPLKSDLSPNIDRTIVKELLQLDRSAQPFNLTPKTKSENMEPMDMSQSIHLGDSLPENWRLVDQEQSDYTLPISETKRINLLGKGKSAFLKVFIAKESVPDSLWAHLDKSSLYLAGVCYKIDGKWMYKAGSGFVLEEFKKIENGFDALLRATHTTFAPLHILLTPNVENTSIEDLSSVPLFCTSPTAVITNLAQKNAREVDLLLRAFDDKLTTDDLAKVIRSHFEKRMGTKPGVPKIHESQVHSLVKMAFSFEATKLDSENVYLTRESFEPFWEWFIEIEDIIERISRAWNSGMVHIMDAIDAQSLLQSQEEGTFLFRLSSPPILGLVISLVNAKKHIVHYNIRKEELNSDKLREITKQFTILRKYIPNPPRGNQPVEVPDKPSFTTLNQILESNRIDGYMALFIKECILNVPSVHQEISELSQSRVVNVSYQGKTKSVMVPYTFTFDQLIKMCPVREPSQYELTFEGKTLPNSAFVGDMLSQVKDTPTLELIKTEIWE